MGLWSIIPMVILFPFAVVPLGMLALMRCDDLLRLNFRGQLVTTSGGIAICASFALQLAVACPFFVNLTSVCSLMVLVGTWFLSIGLVDDFYGDGLWRGLVGHIRALLYHRRVTTGLIKAIGGVIGATAIILWQAKGDAKLLPNWLLGVMLICLSANGINLLDKRPSRALKVFWALCACSIVVAHGNERFTIAMLMVSTLPYAPYDFSCRAMLGDAGANFLGATLGSFIWMATPFGFQLSVLVLWIGLHAYAERRSLTEAIAKSKVLSWLDEVGVKRASASN